MTKHTLFGLLLAMFMTSLQAQEIVDTIHLDPQDVKTGLVNQDIQALARRAIDEDLQLTLTAPEFWKDLVVAQLDEARGNEALNFKYRKTVIENVIIRLITTQPAPRPAAPVTVVETPRVQTDNTETTAQADAAVEALMSESSAQAENEARQVARDVAEANASEMGMSTDKLNIVAPVAAVTLPVSEPDPQEVTQVDEAEPEAEYAAMAESNSSPSDAADDPTPIEDSEALVTAADPVDQAAEVLEAEPRARVVLEPETDIEDVTTPAAPGDADQAAARASLERRLNNGRSIDRDIAVDEIRQGDVLFVTDGVIALVRRGGARQRVYWVDGAVDLESDALNLEQAGKYTVLSTLNIADEQAEQAAINDAQAQTPEAPQAVAPPANQSERARMEALYNDGKTIDEGLSIAGLLPDDTLYVGEGEIMVFRQGRLRAQKFWLEEPIDLELEELVNVGTRKYRVQRVIR